MERPAASGFIQMTFCGCVMRLPSMAEQSKIAAALQVADQEIDSMKLYEDGLRSQKKGLMQRLLTGQVRVQV